MIHNMSLMRKCLAIVLLTLKGTTEIIVSAKIYEVGESFGWRVPPNLTYYSEWANGTIFSIGDKLIFNWTGNGYHSLGYHTSKASYDNCTSEVTSITENGSLIYSNAQFQGDGAKYYFDINQNRTYYFYCVVADHCARGQKFTINVGESSSNSNAPPLFLLAFPAFLSFTAIYFGYL